MDLARSLILPSASSPYHHSDHHQRFHPRLYTSGGLMAWLGSIAALSYASNTIKALPYTPALGTKHQAWLAYCGMVAVFLVPMVLTGPALPPILLNVSAMAASLSTVAVVAPSDEFLHLGAPLAMAFALVLCAAVSTYLLPASAIQLTLSAHTLASYGGIVVVRDRCHHPIT